MMISPTLLIQAVCEIYECSFDDLLSESRHRSVSEPRKVAAYLIKNNSILTHKEVAHIFLRNDHSTSIYWIRWCQSQIDLNRRLKDIIQKILARVGDYGRQKIPSEKDLQHPKEQEEGQEKAEEAVLH